jgi:hypothetical protein
LFKKILYLIIIPLLLGCTEVDTTAFSHVVKEGDKTYIVDQTGHRWDVTQAESIGFKPEKFQYGMGKNYFVPLDDSYLSDDRSAVNQRLRVIGVEDGTHSQAYSVSKLSGHEISNSMLGKKPIAVGY